MKLNELRDNKGAKQARKRVGRGLGSGLGKTSGKGQKGQKARTGVSINGFEGGQNPIYRRLPKRGFNNIFRKEFAELTLQRLQQAIDNNKIDITQTISEEVLLKAGLVKKGTCGVKLLGNVGLNSKVDVEVSKASKSVIEIIKKHNGNLIISCQNI